MCVVARQSCEIICPVMWKLVQTDHLPDLWKEPLHLFCCFDTELSFLADRRKIIKKCSLDTRQIEFVPCRNNCA